MMGLTADICDALGHDVAVADPVFTDFGAALAFRGPAVTLACFEHNGLIRLALEEPGQGSVLVIDGGGSERCALIDASLAQLALANDWAGLIVNGAVRDAESLSAIELPIKALNVHPRPARPNNDGERDKRVRFAGLNTSTGDWVYADLDGIVVSAEEIEIADE